MHPNLAVLVAQLVQPQGLSLLACVPSPAMWLPQLESCAVQVHTGDQLALLADGLQQAEARGLRALHVNDSRPPEDRRAAPARLPALADLPQLHTLVSWAPGMAAEALQPIGMCGALSAIHTPGASRLSAEMHWLPACGGLAVPPPHRAAVRKQQCSI